MNQQGLSDPIRSSCNRQRTNEYFHNLSPYNTKSINELSLEANLTYMATNVQVMIDDYTIVDAKYQPDTSK